MNTLHMDCSEVWWLLSETRLSWAPGHSLTWAHLSLLLFLGATSHRYPLVSEWVQGPQSMTGELTEAAEGASTGQRLVKNTGPWAAGPGVKL